LPRSAGAAFLMFDLAHLMPEEGLGVASALPDATPDLLDALDLAPTPTNALAVAWTLATGEFRGLRIEAPVRMSGSAGAWL
jgi:hypothetical protein